MHPELKRIEDQYLSLVADLQAGHIGQADALAVLTNLTAVDGEGWVWSIDPYSGEFLRALPGQPGAPADPFHFSVSRLPVVPVAVPPHGTPADQVSEYLHPNLHPLPPTPVAERAVSSLSGMAGSIAGGLGSAAKPVRGLLTGRGRTIVVIVVSLVLIAALFAGRPGGESGSETAPTSVPTLTVPPPTIVIAGDEAASSTTNVPVADAASPTTPTTLAPLPSDAELTELLNLLGSGDSAALAPRLPESQRERLDLLAVLGIVRGGFDISFGTPKVSGSSVLVQVRAGTPESPVRRWSLRLNRSATGAWVIVSAAKA
jgi:hypothetical protein